MRSMVELGMSLIAVALLGSALPYDAGAQEGPTQRCWTVSPSYSERTDWYDAEDRFVRDTSTRSSASLVRRFAGTYRLLVVMSEGAWEKEIVEYNLKLAPPTPSQLERIRRIPAATSGRLQVPLVAVIEYRRGAVGQRAMTRRRTYNDVSGEVNFEYLAGDREDRF
jgi:hypothetical protein